MDTMSSSRIDRVPYLALKHTAGSEQPIFFSFSEQKAMDIAGIAELKNNNCWATPQGWILVRDASSSSTYLLDPRNPDTRIRLPHLPEELPMFSTCLLSDYPDTQPSFLVLLLEAYSTVMWYCRVDDEEWVKHEYDIGTQDLSDLGDGRSEKLPICPIAACRGKFYFNASFDEVGVLEFCQTPMFSRMTIPDAIDEVVGVLKIFMVESNKELYMVSLLSSYDFDTVYRVRVYKLDFAKQEWIKVDNLGDRAFLISYWYFGASRSADNCGLERNCVYLIKPSAKCITIYNITDETTKVLDLREAPEWEQAMWMLPTDQYTRMLPTDQYTRV
ncbi:hypothetical protein ACP70R_026218 [Stipagrostis hirtigluma subsp. patula]